MTDGPSDLEWLCTNLSNSDLAQRLGACRRTGPAILLSLLLKDHDRGRDFVFIVMHHPPYTSSSDAKTFGDGHSARSPEQQLAAYLEEQQQKLRARIVVFSGHVHNYEHHEHGGVTYFVTGGGGAHAYPITRAADDLFQSKEVNYHYLLVEVKGGKLKATMNRLEMKDGAAQWTKPDSVTISVPKTLGEEKRTTKSG